MRIGAVLCFVPLLALLPAVLPAQATREIPATPPVAPVENEDHTRWKGEVERLRAELERRPNREQVEREVRDRIATEMDRRQGGILGTLDVIVAMVGVLAAVVGVLVAVPVFAGFVLFLIRRTILDMIAERVEQDVNEYVKERIQSMEASFEEFRVESETRTRERIDSGMAAKLAELERAIEDLRAGFEKKTDTTLQSLAEDARERLEAMTAEWDFSEQKTPEEIAEIRTLRERLEQKSQTTADATTTSVEGLWMKARALYWEREYEASLELIDRILVSREDHASAFALKSAALVALGRFAEALPVLDRAIQLDPEDANLHNTRGTVLGALQRHPEALAAFETAIRHFPDYVKAHNNRGISLGRLKRYEEALAAFDRANELAEDFVSAYSNRGYLLNRLGRNEEALAALDRAIELEPERPNPHAHRAISLLGLGRPEEARAAVDASLTIDPGYARGYYNRARLHLNENDHPAALDDLRRAIELDPALRGEAGEEGDFASLRDDFEYKQLVLDPERSDSL